MTRYIYWEVGFKIELWGKLILWSALFKDGKGTPLEGHEISIIEDG